MNFLMRPSYRAALIKGYTVPRSLILDPYIYVFGYSRTIVWWIFGTSYINTGSLYLCDCIQSYHSMMDIRYLVY